MSQLTLITGLTQSQRQAHIWQFLQGKDQESALPPDCLYLVPSKRKVKHTRNGRLTQTGEGWLPVVYTLSQLANELYFRLGGDKRPIDEFAQRLMLDSLLTQADTKWEFFTPDQLTTSLLKGILRFIAQVKTYSREDLINTIRRYRSPDSLQAKDSDLLRLFQHYQRLLNQKYLVDRQDILTEATQLIGQENRQCRLLGQLSSLVIDGFYYLNPLEQGFIKALIKIFERVVISIDCHGGGDHQLLRQYLGFWQALGAAPEHSLKLTPSPINSTPDNHFVGIAEGLFQPPTQAVSVSSARLMTRSLPQPREEVRAIARDIRQIISHQPGVPLAQIYVVFPQMEVYAPLVQETFPAYGIPYEISKGYPLHSSPVTRAALRLLAIRVNGYQREDWASLFASELVEYSGQINPDEWADFVLSLDLASSTTQQLLSRPPTGEQRLNMPFIDTLARRANLKGGADFRQDWLWPMLKVSRASGIDVEVYRQLYLLQCAWAKFDCLPAKLTGRQFSQGLLQLIRRFNIPHNIIHKMEQIQNYGGRDKQIILKRDTKALDKLHSLLQRMASAIELLGEGDVQLSLSDLHSRLLSHLADEEYHPTDHGEDRVQLVNPPELKGLYFEYLFWGGLTEEGFPRPNPRELFYPPSGRKRLFDRLPRLDEDRYLFSYIFKNTRQRITLSYPLSHEGKPLLPSSFIQELTQVAAIDMQPASPPGCYTRRELVCQIATDWNKGAPPLTLLKALKQLDAEAYYQTLHLLKMEGLRGSSVGFSPYEGALAQASNLVRLGQLNQDNRYAVTQLEDYALCPLSYFFKYLIQLKPVEETVAEFDPQDRGRFLHKIVENFYRQRIEKYHHCPQQIRVTPANLEEAANQMLHSAQRVLNGLHTKYSNLFWQEEKQGFMAGLEPGDNQRPPGLLRAFLEYEAQLADRLIPGYVEFGFGQAAAAPALRLSDLSLEGRVDRIDLAPDAGLFVVYDYKFGSSSASSLIRQGLSFQLPIYMLAIAEYLKDKGYQIGAGGYYQLKSAHQINKTGYFGQQDIRTQHPRELGGSKVLISRQRGYGFLAADELDRQLEQVKTRLLHIHKLITSGRFHPPLAAEDALPCRFCHYARICRLEAIRLANIYPGLSAEEHYKPLREG